MKVGKAEVALAIASSLFAVFALEFTLRVATVPAFRLADPGFYSDTNWFEFHPRLGYTLLRNHQRSLSHLNDDGSKRVVELRTGSGGFRDIVPEPDERPLIAFVGDSFTEAHQVVRSQTYPSLVASKLGDRFRTVNLGVHNYDCIGYYQMGVFARDNYDPRIVFVGLFVGNDINPYNRWAYKAPPNDRFHALRLHLRSNLYSYSWLRAFFTTRTTQEALAPEKAGSGDFFDDFSDLKTTPDHLADYVSKYTAYRIDDSVRKLYANPWTMYLNVKSTVMVLDDLRRDLGDIYLHVLVFPERLQVHDSEWGWLQQLSPGKYQHRHLIVELLLDEMEARGIAFTNMLPEFDRHSYLRFDGHFSEEGHRQTAAAVVRAMEQKYLANESDQ